MDKENVAAFNFSDIRILRNDATVQAVYSEGNTTCWVRAYQPVQLTVSTDLNIEYSNSRNLYDTEKMNPVGT